MAQWYHLFGLLSVLCMSFGALYIVFNSDFNEVCDYSDTIDSCNELKEYKNVDMAWENQQLLTEYLDRAMHLRNESESEKCELEKDLLKQTQEREKLEAQKIIKTCMDNFKECVLEGYTTTTAPDTGVDCTDCNRFCDAAKWNEVDKNYAQVMNFTGRCDKNVCPWLPECGDGAHIHTKCSMRGCPCSKVKCKITTVITTTTIFVAATTTKYVNTTSAKSTTRPNTTSFQSTAKPNSTMKPSTTTSKATTTTFTTTSLPQSTTRNASMPNSTAKVTTTQKPTTTTTRTTTTTAGTTTAGCYCQPGDAGTVLVGRPYKTFEAIQHQFDPQTVELMQGVVVQSTERLPVGAGSTKLCNETFFNRSNYVIARSGTSKRAAQIAAANHFDLSCGYTGTLRIKCEPVWSSVWGFSKCGLAVDISTCQPPTYAQALDQCYTVPTTTPAPAPGQLPQVQDWMGVEEVGNTNIAELPMGANITTVQTTSAPQCEVHVGSVCRKDVDFDFPAKTLDGRWQPKPAYDRQVGYFTVTEKENQAVDRPRPCPSVKIKATNTGFSQWPHCLSACSVEKSEEEFEKKVCDLAANPSIEEESKAVFDKKVESMKAGAQKLADWTAERMVGVKEIKQVIDCFADKLPRRYNAMALPKMRSGFDKMPLHNQCRLHGCKPNQCLEVRRPCKVPFVNEPPEALCHIYVQNGTFSCVNKIEIMSNNPLSLGFGVVWMVVGSLFLCAGVANWIRQLQLSMAAGENAGLNQP